MTIRIIGAGFGRTGTDSLRHALNMLGVGPCHHMKEVSPCDVQKDLWSRKAYDEDIPWSDLFAGFNSVVDWPGAHFWEELMSVYPKASVVMTYRDPESWWRSFEKTILPFLLRMKDENPAGMPWRLIGLNTFDGRPEDKELVLDRYIRNIERARNIVPAERYFEMNLGEGWDRLCAFLDVPCPDEPYPSGNTSADFRRFTGLDPDLL